MATLAELLAQRQELEKQIANLQGAARSEAIDKIRALMAEHGLSVADVSDKADGRESP
jgi:DNA-binding protein H-NS